MPRKFRKNEIVGNKQVLKLKLECADICYYDVKCLVCGRINFMSENGIRHRAEGCKQCYMDGCKKDLKFRLKQQGKV